MKIKGLYLKRLLKGCQYSMIKKYISILSQLKYEYLFSHSIVRIQSGAILSLGKNVSVRNSRITVAPGARLVIADNTKIINTSIFVTKGEIIIGKNVSIGNKTASCSIYLGEGFIEFSDFSLIGTTDAESCLNVENGRLSIGNHAKFAGRRLWIRFGGDVNIGEYTNVNDGSEIRSDERVSIGAYCRISYNTRIWDTNTHEMLPLEERRERIRNYYPVFGKEIRRPATKPVVIGNDCWFGEYAAIMKGSVIGDGAIVGFRTLVCGKEIPPKSRVINETTLKISQL